MEYRKIIVGLNQELDTIQVKMCGREWGKIDHTKTTSQTLNKSKRSLQNIDKQGKMRKHPDPRDTEDRALCAKNFSAHLEAAKSGDDRHKIRGKRVGINDFVKDALRVLSEFDSLSQTYSEAYTDSRILMILNIQKNINNDFVPFRKRAIRLTCSGETTQAKIPRLGT